MKCYRWYIAIACLVLSAAYNSVEAGSATHEFQTMAGSTLILSNSNKTGTTGLFTYQCSGSAVFGLKNINGLNTICLYMPNSTSEVVSDRPIRNLASLQIGYFPNDYAHTNIKVYVSKDGADWGEPLSGSYSKTGITLSFPQSDWYIRLTNTSSTAVWIQDITYQWGDCDCKAVEIPEP